jgi:UDP-GlcNAc:undecaprenyl-phosphate/decaprenyl-phosphate GlcNAc-1-phosphate transferase
MISSFTISSLAIPSTTLAILGLLLAFFITYIAIPSIVTVARVKGLCDMPNSRTSHKGATPTLGGVAIFSGFIITTVIIAGGYYKSELDYIICGLIILFMVGIKDDILVLDPKKKLAAQVLVSVLISVLADIRINNFYGLFGLNEIPYLVSILVTIFVFIVIINGFNLIDGIDGLASGVGILTSIAFGIWFWKTGNVAKTVMSFAFVGSLMAFFWYNVFSKKNKIFLGDTGSMIIGLIMAILTTRFLQLNQSVQGQMFFQSAPAVAFGVLIIPLFDTLRVFIIRIKQGKSPFAADSQHLHHCLLRLGLSHLKATSILLSVNLLFITMCFFFKDFGIIWLMVTILLTALLLSRLLLIYGKHKIKRIIDDEYAAVEWYKVMLKMKKFVNAMPTSHKTLKKGTQNSILTDGENIDLPRKNKGAETENQVTELLFKHDFRIEKKI